MLATFTAFTCAKCSSHPISMTDDYLAKLLPKEGQDALINETPGIGYVIDEDRVKGRIEVRTLPSKEIARSSSGPGCQCLHSSLGRDRVCIPTTLISAS